LDSLGPSGGRGKKPVTAPRFAGRRSQAKRDELEKAKEEQTRREDEAKAAEEITKARSDRARSERGRDRGRGRGAYRGGSQREEPVPSGPFSAGQVSKETQQLNRRWSSRGSGWKGIRVGPEGRSEKKANTRAGRAAKSKNGDGDAGPSAETKPKLDANGDISMEESSAEDRYASSDDEEIGGQRRMDVEKLGIIDLTEDEPGSNALVPIRIARVPHKERGFGSKVDRSAKKEDAAVKVDTIEGDDITAKPKPKERQKARDVEVVAETSGFHAVYSDSESDSKPKPQIKSEPDVEDARDKFSSPSMVDETPSSLKGKGKDKAKPRTLSSNSCEEYDEEIELDREEEERRRNDLDLVRTELGKSDADGDPVMSDAEAGEQRAEKVYLFQFPPTLPDLEPIVVKPDPDASNENGDIMQLDPPSNASKTITIKDEPQIAKLPSGAVGKMRVHASGRVAMDWGGMSLCLGAGARADFLQTVVATTLPDQKDNAAGSASIEEGQAINLGRIKEKFVVTPNWEELLG
jgi:DNA-directed RNA polymerase III subunit RPC4